MQYSWTIKCTKVPRGQICEILVSRKFSVIQYPINEAGPPNKGAPVEFEASLGQNISISPEQTC